MSRYRRLALWLAPLLIGVASMALPGRAQQSTSSRYAFADTLLLRDTLGLDFSRLYPTADSLSVIPDSLRAWMIRWRLQIPRMLAMADSMGYPVDSVGPTIDRERFSVFAAGRRTKPITTFQYGSTYGIQQTSNTWTNNSRLTHSRGPAQFFNLTEIELVRTLTAGELKLRQTRSSSTQADWKISKLAAIGARVELSRYLSLAEGRGVTDGETIGRYLLSGQSKTKPWHGLTSEANFNSGLSRTDNNGGLKRGLTNKIDGRLRYSNRGLTHDLTGHIDGTHSLTRANGGFRDLNANDLNHDIRGTLGVRQNSPIGLLANYRLNRNRTETASGDTAVTQAVSGNNSVDGTLKARVDNDRFGTLNGRVARTVQSNGTRTDRTADASMRWLLLGWAVDGRYRHGRGLALNPRKGQLFGYNERSQQRSAEGSASRSFGQHIDTKLTASIGLDRLRYTATAAGVSLPVDRDNYRQSYRIEAKYRGSQGFSNDLGLEVGMTSLVNIPGRATATNVDQRSYRVDWRWTYQILPGLAANQSNAVSAEYRFYPFASQLNALGLSYTTSTVLTATLTPKLNLQLLHNFRQQPNGSYEGRSDGLDYLLLTDESRQYTLSAPVTYSPSPKISLRVSPSYQEISRFGNQNGVFVPQRRNRGLDFSGGADLNMPIGSGILTGGIQRTFNSTRAISYQGGVAQITPRSEQDYWQGNLSLTWNL